MEITTLLNFLQLYQWVLMFGVIGAFLLVFLYLGVIRPKITEHKEHKLSRYNTSENNNKVRRLKRTTGSGYKWLVIAVLTSFFVMLMLIGSYWR